MTDHAAIFGRQYTQSSGAGSTKDFSQPYREYLSDFIRELGVRSIVDLGCGDLTVMSNLDLPPSVKYLGVDIIDYRVQVNREQHPWGGHVLADLRTYRPPPCDLLLCKDVLQHWTVLEVQDFLDRLEGARFRWAMLTNCSSATDLAGKAPRRACNGDIETGGFRPLDLRSEPFRCNGVTSFRWGDEHAGYKDVVLMTGES